MTIEVIIRKTFVVVLKLFKILYSKFPTDLNDSDCLFYDIELVRESIAKSDAETI